jgi:hypothetical protein
VRRSWHSLVACVSLVAFLAANTHAGMAIAAHFEGHLPQAACTHGCDHQEVDDDADHEHFPGGSPCTDPDCPDCPKDPSAPKCPCPGGCALCSIAKVPCLTVGPLPAHQAPGSGDCLAEPAPLYTSPFSSPLPRPPRA